MVEHGSINPQPLNAPAPVSEAALAEAIADLAREASVEINVQDVKHLEDSRALLTRGNKIYISHLPKQSWQESEAACVAVRAAGFEPVPHLPVRLMPDAEALHRLLGRLVRSAQIKEVLLISGDYEAAAGPYSTVAQVLRGAALENSGLTRVSLAGHPEGHPKVALAEIRGAEREKALLAAQAGLEASLLTQFFFEPKPFLDWVTAMRASGVGARVVAGLAGPARLTTLFKFALRCGAGPSMRALGTRPSSLMKLIGDHGPESLVRALARARASGESDFSGIHLFCFGGYLRTCEWLHAVANGRFELNGDGFSQA
jgi:methylenetetrahydrofolate reductase (NADPH)